VVVGVREKTSSQNEDTTERVSRLRLPVRGHDEVIEMILGLANIYHVKQGGYSLSCKILNYYRLYFF
jgi:hypothetical protein